MNLWTYRAKLIRVIDGDTYYIEVDHGMFIRSVQSLRLKDVDTPEINRGSDEEKALGQDAKSFANAWFINLLGDDEWTLIITTDKDKRSFNRYVATVTDMAGNDLGEAIIEAGHGVHPI